MTEGTTLTSKELIRNKKELADALFLRGEVHMAQYRQNCMASCREKAISDFRASISIDSELGQDSSETEHRIRALGSANSGSVGPGKMKSHL